MRRRNHRSRRRRNSTKLRWTFMPYRDGARSSGQHKARAEYDIEGEVPYYEISGHRGDWLVQLNTAGHTYPVREFHYRFSSMAKAKAAAQKHNDYIAED